MSRVPLPVWARDEVEYFFVGGVEDVDIWARSGGTRSSFTWDCWAVKVMNSEESDVVGFDVYLHNENIGVRDAQARNSERVTHFVGKDNVKRVNAMLRCFAPHLFKGKGALLDCFKIKELV